MPERLGLALSRVRRLGSQFALTLLEQIFIGLGGFLVSWQSLASQGTTQVADYAQAWAAGWGLFSVLSEAIITPSRVRAAADQCSHQLERLRAVLTASSLVLLGCVVVLVPAGQASIGLVLGAGVLGASASVFYLGRAIGQQERRPLRLLIQGGAYATSSLVLSLCVSAFHLHSIGYVMAGAVALLASSRISGPVQWRYLREGIREFPALAWDGRYFAVSTGIRVVLFSVGLISLFRIVDGGRAAAVYAAAFVLISPAQLLSSTLPWLLIGRLVTSVQSNEFGREAGRQLAIYLALTSLGGAILLIAWPWWCERSIRSSAVEVALLPQPWLVVGLMAAVILTSFSSSCAQALRAPRVQLFAVIFGGAIGLLSVASHLPVVGVASVPYLASFAFTIVVLLLLYKPRARLGGALVSP